MGRSRKDLKKIVGILEEQGWEITRGTRHLKAVGPDGQRATIPVSVSVARGYQNTVAQLRRQNAVIPR